MTTLTLPLPEEPRALRAMARTLLEQAPERGLPLVVGGEWLADPLWERWGDLLGKRGLGREAFDRIVADFGNEVRLWVAGERPWEQVASGLAGRAVRRLPSKGASGDEARRPWQEALSRVGVSSDTAMEILVSRIGELHLLYEIDATPSRPVPRGACSGAALAIVWAGARPRDPEAPFGEGWSDSSSAALAEALGHFLLKDPAYPPPP